MDKAIAENLMRSLLDLSASMNVVAGQIEGIEGEEQKLLMRRGIAPPYGLMVDLAWALA